MAAWHAFIGGRDVVLEEYRLEPSYRTEAAARAAAEALGGVLTAEKLSGAHYRTAGGQSFRVSAIGWTAGYAVWGVREQREPVR